MREVLIEALRWMAMVEALISLFVSVLCVRGVCCVWWVLCVRGVCCVSVVCCAWCVVRGV